MKCTRVISLFRQAKKEFGMSQFHSWQWADPALTDSLEQIRTRPGEMGEVIWRTRRKAVYRMDLENDISLAYKTGNPGKTFRYRFLPSPSAREMINYRIFPEFGVPLVQLLGGGEVRRGTRLEESWLITRFAEGYESGIVFGSRDAQTPPVCTDPALRREFLQINIPLLADLNDAGCYHRGFRPYNILFKTTDAGAMECLWLDIASCVFYFLPDFCLRKLFLEDLTRFFEFFKATDEELELTAALYLSHTNRLGMTGSQFTKAIRAAGNTEFHEA